MTINTISAWVAISGFTLMTVFQLALAAGAPLGEAAWGGQHRVLPTKLRIGSAVSVGIFLLGIACVLETAHIATVLNAPALCRVVVWGLTGLTALSTVGNAMSTSKLERAIMTAACLTMTAACLTMLLTSK
ncbi:MAG: hypothetical protein VCD00_02000 [Candidatus Hydrogenedentota bacterium]